jgi:hypothetical protein
MGGQLGPSEKEEWRNNTLCLFHKPKQNLKEGQLPFAKHGTDIVEGNRCI